MRERYTTAGRVIFGIAFCLLITPGSTAGQVRKLHTRDMTRLSQVQIADYLKRSDVVFIPVGAVETNGIQPSGRDYVSPLAYAMTMAEQTDSLYSPGLVWSYPGTTVIAPATIYMTPQAGISFLKTLARSLLRQGFRRQIYLSASHGPAPLTVGTMVREFFDETHVPILYIDMDLYLPKMNISREARSKTVYGAHYIAGRIEDMPIKGDYGVEQSKAAGPIPENTGLAELGRLGFSGSLTLGSWVPDVMAHGGGDQTLPANAAERDEWGKQGKGQIESIVKQMRMSEALSALRKHDQFTQELVKKFGKIVPDSDDMR